MNIINLIFIVFFSFECDREIDLYNNSTDIVINFLGSDLYINSLTSERGDSISVEFENFKIEIKKHKKNKTTFIRMQFINIAKNFLFDEDLVMILEITEGFFDEKWIPDGIQKKIGNKKSYVEYFIKDGTIDGDYIVIVGKNKNVCTYKKGVYQKTKEGKDDFCPKEP